MFMPELVQTHSYVSSFLSVCPESNFQNLEKKACSRYPKADEACGAPKELSIDISALPQDPREAHLHTRRTNY